MSIREELLKLVGSEKFTDAPKVLKEYSTDFSLAPSGMPNYVVKPKRLKRFKKLSKQI